MQNIGHEEILWVNCIIQQKKLEYLKSPRDKHNEVEFNFIKEILNGADERIKDWWSVCLKSPSRKNLIEAAGK